MSSAPYPYLIPPFRGKLAQNPPHMWVNEFLMIEAILRSDDTIAAYRENLANHGELAARKALNAILRTYGIIGHDVLNGTHHVLITATSPQDDKEWKMKLASLGYPVGESGIVDLGVLAKLPPDSLITHGMMTVYGAPNGEADCLAYLRSNNPRFLCLRLDTSYPPSTIIKDIKPLLRERHETSKNDRIHGLLKRTELMKKEHVRDVTTWLNYFKCYDLRMEDWSIKSIADHVFPRSKDPEALTNQGLQGVRRMIRTIKKTGWLPLTSR